VALHPPVHEVADEARVGAEIEERAAGAQHPRRLREHRPDVVDVGVHERGGDAVERAGGERQRERVGLHERHVRRRGDAQLVGRQVDADEPAPLRRDRVEVQAGAAGDVEPPPAALAQQFAHREGAGPRRVVGEGLVVVVRVTVVPRHASLALHRPASCTTRNATP
jgi:hypothetical protein